METIGRHLIAEFYGCPSEILDDVDTVRAAMGKAVEAVGATPVGETFHHFAPQGVTGVIVIAESHLSIHTWPENGYVAVDIYTCGGLDPRPGFRSLGADLSAERCRVQEIVRGLPEHLEAGQKWEAEDVQVISRISEESLCRPREADPHAAELAAKLAAAERN